MNALQPVAWTKGIIRKEQMQAFERKAIDAFEGRTYRHLQQWFPHHCELLGEVQIGRVVRHGWQKANSYAFTAECCVRSYIEFMCLLGSGFDSDTLLPWASEILNEKSLCDEVVRGDKLYDKVWDYVDHIRLDYRDPSGQPTTARFMQDLRQIRHTSDKIAEPIDLPQFLESLKARFQRLFPAKCAYVGDELLTKAVSETVDSAGRYGITAERGLTIFSSIRFILGGRFDQDPLLPWAQALLNDSAIPDQFKRADRLFLEAVSFLRRWWDVSSQPGELKNVME